MYKIRRVNITDVFLFCRCYGSQRNQPNHYETLCVQNNSSQKEIRDAFLKLSKELHPDIGSKGSHAKFVKLNEAYKILSKDYTRKQYDIDLKWETATAENGESHRHSDGVFYHNAGDHKSQTAEARVEFEKNYYGIKGIKRVSNGTIAAICVVVCLLIVSLEIVALRRSVKKSQNYMNSRSLQAEQDYAEARARAQSLTREEQIDAVMKKFDAQNGRYNLEEEIKSWLIMRDMAGKMAELKFEAPLARFEEEETSSLKNINLLTEQLLDASLEANFGENRNANESVTTRGNGADILQEGTFSPFSGSLEDLVNTFDEKITSCFRDYGTDVESLAPVQVRTQEEIMNECQMWWTITGNFGNILPIDWSKSYARKLHMPALNLNEAPVSFERQELEDLSSEDEAVATDLDMHALILSSSTDTHSPEEPLKTAEEVLREIDDMMQESPSMERSPDSEGSLLDVDETLERSKEVLGSPLYEEKLRQLSSGQLTELYGEMESLVAALSETLISELALRDELEYEKELKNQFISLLLAVQNRRRQHHVTKKRSQIQNSNSPLPQHRSIQDSKYLTTVIPYHMDSGPPDNQALQVLIKILKAINEDSPTVPTLLTDYILKVLCPT